MINQELDSIKKAFINYLDSIGVSPKTHKNYRSDLNHFIGWVILKVRSFGSYAENLTDSVPFLSRALAGEYLNYLLENKIPAKTINRRLSTLRHLSKFLVGVELIDVNFMDGLENIGGSNAKKISTGSIVDDFRTFLEAEKVSKSTIKNYVSDVNQFLAWLENNPDLISENLN